MIGVCPESNQDCPYFEEGCYSDVHHEYFPRRNYRTKIEKQFRELPANKEQLCRLAHDILHLTERPPIKPDRDVMITAIGQSALKDVA